MGNQAKHKARQVIYLYGITEDLVSSPGVAGVDGGSRVEPLNCAGLVCWISHVSAREFADKLAEHMEDLDWLAQASVRHQRAISSIAESVDILPARLGTVFRSEDSLASDVRARKRRLLADFTKIRGSEEWGIKVFAVPPQQKLPPQKRTGKEYLKAKAALLQKHPAKPAQGELQRFSHELQQIAVDITPGGKLSGAQKGLEWQTSLLLKRNDRKRLDELLQKFSKRWAGVRQIEYSGPWPPYSFLSRRQRKGLS